MQQGSTGPPGIWGQPPVRVLLLRGFGPYLCSTLCTGTLIKCRRLPPAILCPAGTVGSAPGGSEGAVEPWLALVVCATDTHDQLSKAGYRYQGTYRPHAARATPSLGLFLLFAKLRAKHHTAYCSLYNGLHSHTPCLLVFPCTCHDLEPKTMMGRYPAT